MACAYRGLGSPLRGLLRLIAAFVLLTPLLLVPATPAHASSNTYFFHGAAGSASFDTNAPSGASSQTQTASPLANRDYAGDPLAAWWQGSYSGTLSGSMQLDWWWSSANATAILLGLGMDVTVFADADPSTGSGTVVGRQFVTLQVGATPKENVNLVAVAGTVQRNLLIEAVPHYIDTGNAPVVSYDATSTPSGFSFVPTPTAPPVTFDTTQQLTFAPSTVVSPSFLGGEPETTMEHPIPGSQAGRIDPNRVFVDWPLSSRTQTSQVSRSNDGGDHFRMLLDLNTCPQRNRPNCLTGGGGDSKTDVNLYDGNLFFADQEVLANEAVASSTDHGDTWPNTRQFAISNTASAVDRQWLAYIDPSVVSLPTGHADAFLAYHLPAAGQYIQAIDQNGVPVPQPVAQITGVSQSGTLRVDNSTGPGHGWIYQPYRGTGVMVATANATGYQVPQNWQTTKVSDDSATIFPWLQIDSHGNAYLVWVSAGNLFLSVSPIDDARNNPAKGGRPGTYWTRQAEINPPGVTSTVFPEVTAGDTGRIGITFVGSTDCSGQSDNCAPTAHWNTYAEVISDALALVRGTSLSVVSGVVNHRVMHRGSICTSGTTCTGDRSLLDMIDLGYDASGRVGVVFTDNNNRLAAPTLTDTSKNGPFTQFAKATAGPALLANQPAVNVSIPQNGRAAAAGDATWPNTAAGTNLPSLDLTGASIGLSADGSQLVAKLALSDATLAGMTRDLAAYNASTTQTAARLQYTARFATADDVFHLDMDFEPGRTPQVRFFGGRLDANDGVQNGTGTIVGSRYVADAGYTVTGSIRNGVLTLMAPKTQFGLDTGSPVFSVTGFAMAGPDEGDATATLVANSSRTVDASPPFDAKLQTVQSPPTGVSCDDGAVTERGGWQDESDDPGGSGGTHCRQVGGHAGASGSGDDMQMGFYGTGVDLVVAKGPRGGSFNASIDSGPPVFVDEYRPPTDPAHPDMSGRHDLTTNVKVHLDAPGYGYHTVHVRVVNGSTDKSRNMVYVDGFTVYGGDGVGAPTSTRDVSTLVNGVLGALLGAEFTVASTANTYDLNFVLEAVPGTTLTIKDPTGKVVATGTVQDGVLAVGFPTNGVLGAFVVDVRNTTGGEAAFNLWEVVGGS